MSMQLEVQCLVVLLTPSMHSDLLLAIVQEESRAQQPRYQQRLSRAAGFM